MKNELRDLISGKIKAGKGAIIQAAAHHLAKSAQAGEMVKGTRYFKDQEAARLKPFIDQNQLWVSSVDLAQYIDEGAEQKVYLTDGRHVIKLNDIPFYESWIDYFHALLLHNYFFPDTGYELMGFFEKDQILFAVVKQPYVTATEKTDLANVREFMATNGFLNTRNNDYYHPELGLILEDLHEENVLTQDTLLYFVDTVFYIKPEFYED